MEMENANEEAETKRTMSGRVITKLNSNLYRIF